MRVKQGKAGGGGWMCVFIFDESKLPLSFSSFRAKNRKTVCFLLLSKLPFTHFRYSINLIAIPNTSFHGRRENISKQFLILMFASLRLEIVFQIAPLSENENKKRFLFCVCFRSSTNLQDFQISFVAVGDGWRMTNDKQLKKKETSKFGYLTELEWIILVSENFCCSKVSAILQKLLLNISKISEHRETKLWRKLISLMEYSV